MSEPTTKEREKARVNTFRRIVADACNEFSAQGGDPTVVIDELVECISAWIYKMTPREMKVLRPVIQLGAIMAMKTAFTKHRDEP